MKEFFKRVFANQEVRRGAGHLIVGVAVGVITALLTRDPSTSESR